MANEKNLIPFDELTESERREIASKGGTASGEARLKKKTLRETLKSLLELPCDVEGEQGDNHLSACVALLRAAQNGNIKAFEVLRDTIGEKPADSVKFGADSSITGIKISFVDKSKKREGAEKDPKIVGEYTNPVDIKEG